MTIAPHSGAQASTAFENLAGTVLDELICGVMRGSRLLVVDRELRVLHSAGDHPASLAGLVGQAAEPELAGLCRAALAGRPTVARCFETRGETRSVDVRALYDRASGLAVAVLVLARHATVHDEQLHTLRYAANHDAITGLFNAAAFLELLGRHAAQAARYGATGSLLLIDIDGFREVNEDLGEGAANALLFSIGELLRDRLRRTDVLARLSADRFAALLTGAADEESGVVAEALLAAVRSAAPSEAGVTASVGFAALAAIPSPTAERLMHAADFALYRAKAGGGDRWVRYVAPEPEPEL